MRVVAAAAPDREKGGTRNEDENVEAGGKTREKGDEDVAARRRRDATGRATLPSRGMKRRSVVADARKDEEATGGARG